MARSGAHEANGKTPHGSFTRADAPCLFGTTGEGLDWSVYQGDARLELPKLQDSSFNCVITSPPYFWQRDYKEPDQIGLEPSVEAYVAAIADVMDQVYRVLAKNGLLFLNLGDTYYSRKGEPKGSDKKNWARRFGRRVVDVPGLGIARKTLIGIPWRVALEMIERGWTLRCPIIWRKKKPQPEPTAKDRPWRTYEMVFMFSKSPVYHFRREELGAEEDFWTIPTQSKNNQKSATAFFPEALVRRCLEIGCVPGGQVLDVFAGTGTVLRSALASGRPATGIEVSGSLCKQMAACLRKL